MLLNLKLHLIRAAVSLLRSVTSFHLFKAEGPKLYRSYLPNQTLPPTAAANKNNERASSHITTLQNFFKNDNKAHIFTMYTDNTPSKEMDESVCLTGDVSLPSHEK